MSASPFDPNSQSAKHTADSPFEATEHYFAGDQTKDYEATNDHHHPGPAAPVAPEAEGSGDSFGKHLQRHTAPGIQAPTEPNRTAAHKPGMRSGISAKVRIRTHSFDLIEWISKKFSRSDADADEPPAHQLKRAEDTATINFGSDSTEPAPGRSGSDLAQPPRKAPPEAFEEAIPPPHGEEIAPMNHPFDLNIR